MTGKRAHVLFVVSSVVTLGMFLKKHFCVHSTIVLVGVYARTAHQPHLSTLE